MSIEDKITRGKTRPGRLRVVDDWLEHEIASGFCPRSIVDFGPGEHAWTTLELEDRVAPLVPGSRIVAVENDPSRCANLVAESKGRFEVIQSGFEFGLENVDLIRAMNVFRQYAPSEASDGYDRLRRHLSPGGILICGTCDRGGDIGTFWRMEASGSRSLVLFTTGARGFAPRQFRDFLPRDIRRTSGHDHPFLSVLPQWDRAWRSTRAGLAPREAFDTSVKALSASGLAALVSSGIAEFDVE